jgi:hypothetical protein
VVFYVGSSAARKPVPRDRPVPSLKDFRNPSGHAALTYSPDRAFEEDKGERFPCELRPDPPLARSYPVDALDATATPIATPASSCPSSLVGPAEVPRLVTGFHPVPPGQAQLAAAVLALIQ